MQAALDHFGRIDAVVNNAGILRDAIFHKMEPADWDAVVNVHLNGSFYVSRAAAPHFRAQGSGAYVHMTSTSGLIGNFGQANYSAAKLGICALSKSIALDMARFNVRSNCIAPNAWSRMIGSIPVTNDGREGAGGTAAAYDAREERAAGGVPRVGARQGGERADLRVAEQRDLPHQPQPRRCAASTAPRAGPRN